MRGTPVWLALGMVLVAASGSVAMQDQTPSSQPPAMGAPAPKGQAEARIVQLEIQLAQAQREVAVLRAQLAIALEPQTSKSASEKMHEAEKAMGCPIDWAAVPPTCAPKEGKP